MSWRNFFVPPGAGIYTVSTGSDLKNNLWQSYYNSVNPQDVEREWKKSIKLSNVENAHKNNQAKIFACPSDSGAGIIKGSNWGPLFLRQALLRSGIQSHSLKDHDLGDMKVNPHLLHDDLLSQHALLHIQQQMYPFVSQEIASTLPVSPLSQIDFFTHALWSKNPWQKFLFFAGDHSCSYPIVKNWCQTRADKNFAVLHFDAHTDLLQERLGIPYCFGTWAYQILPFLPHPSHLVQVGIRASGKTQQHWEETLGVKQYWSKEIRELSPDDFVENLINYYKQLSVQEIYVSFDVDVLDPAYLSCTGTCEEEGLFPHHVAFMIKTLRDHFTISCIDVVEFAPFIRQALVPKPQLEPETSLITLQMLLSLFWESLNSAKE